MFSFPNKRRQGSITVHPALRRAASLARAFILLEDHELSGPRTPDGEPQHPHRVPLRLMGGTRRPGAGVPREQRCLSPVPARTTVHAPQQNWQRAAGPVRVGRCASSHVPH
jgi:hypothetical protein